MARKKKDPIIEVTAQADEPSSLVVQADEPVKPVAAATQPAPDVNDRRRRRLLGF